MSVEQKWTITPCVAVVLMMLALAAKSATGMSSEQNSEVMANAREALVLGHWQQAASLGEAAGTAAGFALAAEALTIYAHYFEATESKRPMLLQRAVELAEEANRIRPSDPQLLFQLAHAVGRYAQNIPTSKALLEGHIRRSRQLAEDTLALDPDMVYALLQLGSWHAEVVDRAGPLVARLTYGARAVQAIEHYERAIELAAEDPVVCAEVGRGLLLLSHRRHGDRARELLRQAVALQPQDAYAQLRQQQAKQQLEAFR